MLHNVFYTFTDDELQATARAYDSAAGEGAFGNETDVLLAQALRFEAKRRKLLIEAPYGGAACKPDDWLTWIEMEPE